MKTVAVLAACVIMFSNILPVKYQAPFESLTVEQRAAQANMQVQDFIFISSVTEAESDRMVPEEGELTTEGRVMIAIVILNRVESDRFTNQDSIYDVLTASGQFSTVVYSNGNYHSVTERTDYSDAAVIEAVRRIEAGSAPDCLFFNCRGFFTGTTPYGEGAIGGNYFST